MLKENVNNFFEYILGAFTKFLTKLNLTFPRILGDRRLVITNLFIYYFLVTVVSCLDFFVRLGDIGFASARPSERRQPTTF